MDMNSNSMQVASFQYVSPILSGSNTQQIINVLDPWRFDLPNGQDCLIHKITMRAIRIGGTSASSNVETANGQVAFNCRFRLQSVADPSFIGPRGVSNPVINVQGDTALGVMDGTRQTNIGLSYLVPEINFPCGIVAGRFVFSQFGFYVANLSSGNTQFNVDMNIYYEML